MPDQKTLRSLIDQLCGLLARFSAFPGRDGLLEDLRALGERAALKVRNLTYVLLFGPTGCGKSKIANSLFGRILTPVGYRRPTTLTPRVIVPAAQGRAVVESLPVLPFEIVELETEAFARLVLIDAPDIDSLLTENRTIAEGFLRFADALVVVLEPTKYADESIWNYLRKFEREGVTFRLVLNKVKDPRVTEDLEEKLRQEGIKGEVLAIPFQASHDHEILRDCEGLQALRSQLNEWADSERIRREATRRSAQRGMAQLTDTVLPHLEERRREAAAAREKLERTCGAVRQKLERGLPFSIDRDTVSEIYKRLLGKLERIDPLRLPRRILSYPFRLLREKFGGTAPQPSQAPEVEKLWDLKEEAFLGMVLEILEEAEEILERGEIPPPPAPTESAIRDAFRTFRNDFRRWVEEEADKLAGTLTVGQRVRFYVAQTLVIGALLGVELQTGGMLTVTEVVTGGIVSPFAAKLIGMALSAEESRRFHEKVRDRFLEGATELAESYLQPSLRAVKERESGLDLAEKTAAGLRNELAALAGRNE